MTDAFASFNRWRMRPTTAAVLAALLAILLAVFYQPFYLSEPLLDIPRGAAFGLNLAAPLLLAIGLMALLRPDIGLCFAILTAPLSYRSRGFFDGSVPAINNKYIPLHEIMLLLALGASALFWLIGWLGQRRAGRDSSRARPNWRSLILPGLWLLAGTLAVLIVPAGGEERAQAWREWRWLIVEPLLLYGLVLWWGARIQDSEFRIQDSGIGNRESGHRPPTTDHRPPTTNHQPPTTGHRPLRTWLLVALILSGVAVALVGLLQRRGIDLTPTEATGQCFSDFSVADGGIVRTSSVFCHPNNLALWLGRVWPVALVLLVAAGLRLRSSWPARPREWLAGAFYLGCFLITGISMLLTYSKGARFAGAAVLLALSLLPRRWWFTVLTVVVLSSALAYSTFNGPERLDVGGDSSSARLSIWRSAAAMLADHPLAGVGMGQFYYNFNPEFGGTYIEEQLRNDPAESKTSHPHNLVLDLLLRVGLLGALAFAALIGRAGWRGWRIWRSGHGERWLALAALAGLAVGLLHGMVDQGYFSTELAMATWLSLGVIDGIWPEIRSAE